MKFHAFFLLLFAALPSFGQTVLPITAKDGLLRVTVLLNDTPVLVALDTGAKTTLFSRDAIKRAGLTPNMGGHITGYGGSGKAIGGAFVSVRMGHQTNGISVGVLALPDFLKDCDGVLGMDVLGNYSGLLIDFKAHTLTILE